MQMHIVDLYGGDIDRNRQWIGPARRFSAGGAQYPFANLQNEPAFLGDRYEHGGRNGTALGMVPAQQRLEAGYRAALNIDLRLIDDPQLIARNRVSQLMLQKTPIAHIGTHFGLEIPVDSTAVLLGPIERRVGVVGQVLRVVGVAGEQRDANAGRNQRAIGRMFVFAPE